MELLINYAEALKNNVKADAEKAIQIFLAGEVGTPIIIFPQALNPTLKALESLCIWKQALIIPYSDSRNKPIYIIVKIGKNQVTKVTIQEAVS
jgi:hypothetical protein